MGKKKELELECGISVGCILYTGNSTILKQSNSFRMVRWFLPSRKSKKKSQQLLDTHYSITIFHFSYASQILSISMSLFPRSCFHFSFQFFWLFKKYLKHEDTAAKTFAGYAITLEKCYCPIYFNELCSDIQQEKQTNKNQTIEQNNPHCNPHQGNFKRRIKRILHIFLPVVSALAHFSIAFGNSYISSVHLRRTQSYGIH